MNYKLEELKEDTLTDFLLNPLLRNAYYEDYLVQKYPISDDTDHIIVFDKEGLFYKDRARTPVTSVMG